MFVWFCVQVHGVKKEEIHLQLQAVGGHTGNNDNNHEGIMDLAQHSDHSN